MKEGLRDIVGKHIVGVVFAKAEATDRYYRLRVFLAFDDATSFELYGPDFSCCSGLDDATRILRKIGEGGGEVRSIYGELPQPAAVGTCSPSPTHDASAARTSEVAAPGELRAWAMAHRAIERARKGS